MNYGRLDSHILLVTQEVGMRVRPAPASPLYPKIRVAFTDHPITVWAGPFCSGSTLN